MILRQTVAICWSRTFPLLKRALLLGVGQDNFAYAFPNDDYVGKVNCGFNEQIVTKPHNMYFADFGPGVETACAACIFRVVSAAFWQNHP